MCPCVATYVERQRGFHCAKLLHLGLHEAGTVAAHGRHGLGLPIQGKELGHACLLTAAGEKTHRH